MYTHVFHMHIEPLQQTQTTESTKFDDLIKYLKTKSSHSAESVAFEECLFIHM